MTDIKSNSLTVRLEPKLRYGLELLARKQRRNLSGVVEWALLCQINSKDDGIDLEKLWDVDEVGRINCLSKYAPELLTFEERKYLKEFYDD